MPMPYRAKSNTQRRTSNISSTKRGYTYAWQQLRKEILRKQPICMSCGVSKAVMVHHVPDYIPHTNHKDYQLIPICAACHSKQGSKKVVSVSDTSIALVCGPPGSGKTTFVDKHKQWGDLIVDIDTLFIAISGLPFYEKPEGLLPFVMEAREGILQRLLSKNDVRQAWIITTGARARDREEFKQKYRAKIYILEKSKNECMKNILNDDRRKDKVALWEALIDKWWEEYT